jgi:hypothetical protein
MTCCCSLSIAAVKVSLPCGGLASTYLQCNHHLSWFSARCHVAQIKRQSRLTLADVCGVIFVQVGISDSWVQLSHLVKVFGGRELTPPVVAAMWKRLAGGLLG